jgi:hypothetical protein
VLDGAVEASPSPDSAENGNISARQDGQARFSEGKFGVGQRLEEAVFEISAAASASAAGAELNELRGDQYERQDGRRHRQGYEREGRQPSYRPCTGDQPDKPEQRAEGGDHRHRHQELFAHAPPSGATALAAHRPDQLNEGGDKRGDDEEDSAQPKSW